MNNAAMKQWKCNKARPGLTLSYSESGLAMRFEFGYLHTAASKRDTPIKLIVRVLSGCCQSLEEAEDFEAVGMLESCRLK